MLNDKLVSMDNGPVNSITLNRINGFVNDDDWREFVSDRENHFVGVVKEDLSEKELRELSRAELRTLDNVWNEYGQMNQWELVKHTHDKCQEWEDPHGSSSPIPYARVFKAIGKQNAAELEAKIMSDRKLLSILRG